MLRVVVDPNVFVSAVIQPGGVRADGVRAGLAGRYRFVVCPKLIDELAGVLVRPKLAPYTAADQAAALVDSIVGTAEVHEDPEPRGRLLRDAADEYLVALASQTSAGVNPVR